MTLTVRNRFFRGGIILAAFSLGLAIAGGYFAFPAFPDAAASAAVRTRGVIQHLIGDLVKPSAYVPFWTMLGAVFFSFMGITFISFFFEKTQSPEIIFFGFFIISLSFECARIAVPLRAVFPFPAMYLISASRVLLFGRYFGLFSLFAASVYAAGFDARKQQNVFIMLTLGALVIALNVPIDSLAWDTAFRMMNGYSSMFVMVDAGILGATVVTFLISAYTRGSRTYVFTGAGSFLMFAGRNLLVNSDTWITPVPGILLLLAGTWFICAWLHREYLWL